MNNSLKIRVYWFLSLLLIFFIWLSSVVLFNIAEYLVPNPVTVAKDLFNNLPSYLIHAKITAIEAGSGFVLGNTLAILSGIVLFRFNSLKQLTMPAIAAIQAIPIVALAPLLIVWFGSGMISKVIMAAVISFFPTMAALLSSFSEVDHNAKLLFRLYRASYLSTVRHLLIPAALPTLVTGLKEIGRAHV